MDAILNHVTIRNFCKKGVPDALLRQLLEAGIRASTTGNMQWYSIIITKEETTKNKLAALHFNQRAAVSAPVILTLCADINRFNKWCLLNKANPAYGNFISFFNAATDALLVAQNICVSAENAGLGICYLGTALYNAAEIIDLLNIPEMVVPVTSIALGWPESVPPLTDRLPFKAVIHEETYLDYREEDIKNLYNIKENLNESKQFVAENGVETLAQVFTQIRYKKSDNEHYSSKLLMTLRKQGFDV